MTREIKFRAWNNTKEEFAHMMKPEDIIHLDGETSKNISNNIHLMQWTGLLDKEGVEIYEGDIVKVENYSTNGGVNPDWFDFIGDVKYYEAQFFIDNGIQGVELFQEIPKLEVIGNIYENHELFEVEL